MDEQEGCLSVGIFHPGCSFRCRHISKLKRLVKVPSLQQFPCLLLQGYGLQHPYLQSHTNSGHEPHTGNFQCKIHRRMTGRGGHTTGQNHTITGFLHGHTVHGQHGSIYLLAGIGKGDHTFLKPAMSTQDPLPFWAEDSCWPGAARTPPG